MQTERRSGKQIDRGRGIKQTKRGGEAEKDRPREKGTADREGE